MDVTRALLDAGLGTESPELAEAARWIADHYHEEWHFGKALSRGIGVHHGRIPRALGQFIVRRFNEGTIGFLVCTTTLIEGVNTKARNMVIFDNTINRDQIDRFTFNNIRGRAGRMGQHYVGHVYVFHEPPPDELPEVNIPVVTQPAGTPQSLLVQLAEEDLSEDSKERLRDVLAQRELSLETIRMNNGLDVQLQVAFATTLRNRATELNPLMTWSGWPTYNEIRTLCTLIWNNFNGPSLGAGSIRSASQLTFMVNTLRYRPTARELIRRRIDFSNEQADDAVAVTLDFLRLWANFHLPKLIRAIHKIQQEVFQGMGLPTGDYEAFASMTESLFHPPNVIALDEYGLPIEITRKIENRLGDANDLDETLAALKRLNTRTTSLSPFEIKILNEVRAGL